MEIYSISKLLNGGDVMDLKYMPEFNHKYITDNGALLEKYYIDNKKVDSSVYYSILEDFIVYVKDDKNNPITIDKDKDKCFKSNEYNILLKILEKIYSLTTDEAVEYISELLLLQHNVGYCVGQIELSNSYAKNLFNYKRNVKKSLNSILNVTDFK